jgi:hypothetical protein
MAGPASYLSLDVNNNVVLAAGDGATTPPAGLNTQIQFNDGGSAFGASANLTFDGSALGINGGVIHKRTAVSSNYTASVTDYVLGVTTTPISIELNASSFTEGQVLIVKDESGTAAAASTITLSASGAQTIDGGSSATIESPYGAVFVYTNGSNWFIY